MHNPSQKERFIIQKLFTKLIKFIKKEEIMAKITAWLVTLIGVLLILAAPGIALWSLTDGWVTWVVALAVLIVGIGKLSRNYSKKRK